MSNTNNTISKITSLTSSTSLDQVEPVKPIKQTVVSSEPENTYTSTVSLFGLSKKDKSHMVGSPKRKRNFNISPSKHKEVKKYKGSRDRTRNIKFLQK
jgi:hypothetical protein